MPATVLASAATKAVTDKEVQLNGRNTPRARTARMAGIAGLVAAAAIGGAVLAGTMSANAASTTTATAYAAASTSGGVASGSTRVIFPAHGTAAHEALEKAVTGADAVKAKAAAVKAAGGGTAGAVTTDMSGNGYEVTVTKSGGSQVEVHLDQSFKVRDPGRTGG